MDEIIICINVEVSQGSDCRKAIFWNIEEATEWVAIQQEELKMRL